MPVVEIIWQHGACRKHDDLPKAHRERIEAALDRLALTGLGDVVPYQGAPGVYRLRAGSYRIFFTRAADSLVILAIERRDQAYR